MSISTTPPKTRPSPSGRRSGARSAISPGIRRFGSILMPMDETLTQVAVDISNRPYLIWKVQFARPKIGEMDTNCSANGFQALAQKRRHLPAHRESLR